MGTKKIITSYTAAALESLRASGGLTNGLEYQDTTNNIRYIAVRSDLLIAIPTKLSQLSGDTTNRVVTDAEKNTWNSKQSTLTTIEPYMSFDTYVEMQDYLTNDNRYSGQIVSCKDVDGSIFELDLTKSVWLEHRLDTSNTVAELIINNTQTLTGFDLPHGTCVAGDYIYMGMRDAVVLRIVKVNSNDLSDFTVATLTTTGSSIETLVYDPITDKIYGNAVNGTGAKILCIDPTDLSFTVFYSSIAFDFGASPAFNIIGDYLYAISYWDGKFYKFQISTGTLINTISPIDIIGGHNMCNDGTYLYCACVKYTSPIAEESTFLKIHKDTLAIQYLPITEYLIYTDDICCNVSGGVTIVYCGVEFKNKMLVVNGTDLTFNIVYSTGSYGTFTDGIDLYSCAYNITGVVKYPNFDTANPIIVVDPLDSIVNELFFVNNKLFYATFTSPSIIREYEFPANTTPVPLGAFAKGLGARALDNGSVAIGYGAAAKDYESMAVGNFSKSIGGGAAIGVKVSVVNGAHAFGFNITNTGANTVGYGIGNPYPQILCQDSNVAIGVASKTEAEPACSAFTVQSANQGILIPRHDEFSKSGINGLVEGCMIYNTELHKLEVWNGTEWI